MNGGGNVDRWGKGGEMEIWGGEINPNNRVFVVAVLKAVYEG